MPELSREDLRAELERITREAGSDQARVSAMRLLLQMQREDLEAETPMRESAFEGLYAVGRPRQAS